MALFSCSKKLDKSPSQSFLDISPNSSPSKVSFRYIRTTFDHFSPIITRAYLVNGLYCVCLMCLLSSVRILNERRLHEKYDLPREIEARQWLENTERAYLSKNTYWRKRVTQNINSLKTKCTPEIKDLTTISIDFPGRTANHMFNIASLMGIAHRNCMRPVLRQPVIPRAFNFSVDLIHDWPPVCNITYIQEFGEFRGGGGYDIRTENISKYRGRHGHPAHIHLQGFFQSWKYFHQIRSYIREQFVFLPDVQEQAKAFLSERVPEEYRSVDTVKVGIHNRRGDKLHPVIQWAGALVSSPRYVRAAMKFFESRYPRVLFIICGDDTWYNQATYGGAPNVIVSDNDDAMVDLAILTMSDHIIMTIGTFGWWAGYLVDGIVLYDPKFAKPNSRLDREVVKTDHFLPHWVPIHT